MTEPEVAHAHWLHTARDLADDLATDAVEREQAGKPPFDEVERLRESGLLTLLAEAGNGGGGADWRAAFAVVRTVAAADGAIGQLLGSHYFLSAGARFFARPVVAARVERESAAGRWCWGGGIASDERPLTLMPAGNGYFLDGHHSGVTGAGVADRLLVRAARAGTGEPLAVLVDPAHPGAGHRTDGETFGQRPAVVGGADFDAVPVAPDDVFGSLSADEGVLSPFAGLAAPVARLMSAHFCLGVADALLEEAREHHPPNGPTRDPYLIACYGELTVLARSASALAEQAVGALTLGLARGEDLDDDECAEIAVLASAAEAAATGAAQDITTRALDVIGAGAAAQRHGLDRFWRDVRTHTLREPVAHRLREVGDYFLNGSHPAFVLP